MVLISEFARKPDTIGAKRPLPSDVPGIGPQPFARQSYSTGRDKRTRGARHRDIARIERESGPERVAEVGAEIARAGIDAGQFVGIDPEGLRSPWAEFHIGHHGEIIGIAGSQIGATALADIGVAAHEMHEPAFVQSHILPAGADIEAIAGVGIDIEQAA